MKDWLNVESPRASKKVRAEGRSEDFVALGVDTERLMADLLSVERARRPGEDVPWLSFLAIRQPAAEPLN